MILANTKNETAGGFSAVEILLWGQARSRGWLWGGGTHNSSVATPSSRRRASGVVRAPFGSHPVPDVV